MPFLPERRPVHPLETALACVVAANLCLLPWALGDMHAWSQVLGGAVILAGVLLVSRKQPVGPPPEGCRAADYYIIPACVNEFGLSKPRSP